MFLSKFLNCWWPIKCIATIAWFAVLTSQTFAETYDATWHKEFSWSGEHPFGFTVKSNVTLSIRSELDREAKKNIACLLEKGATYHEWNKSRVQSDKLQFVSFTKIATYEIEKAFTAQAQLEADKSTVNIHFTEGDRWSYLYYGAEGEFLFRYGNVNYMGDQDLISNSKNIDAQEGYDEWLGLRCANGVSGWILTSEIKELPEFASPNIKEYGRATDLPKELPSTYWNHNGSVVYLEADGNKRRFYYLKPREGMLEAGASPNSLLFQGEAIGNRYVGEAFIFRRNCGQFGYHVEGPIINDGRGVLLVGKAPRVNASCLVIGTISDRLLFELQSSQ